jgi:riboflavin kinase/FMN adenylyltransferase
MSSRILITREALPDALRGKPLVAAMGLFDGVHLAHQTLLAAAGKAAVDIHGALLVHTFDRNPLDVLTPPRAPKALMPMAARIKSINAVVLGKNAPALCTLVRQFTILFAQLPPERFIRGFTETFKPAEVFVGYNYTFGAGGKGDVPMLRELGVKLGFSLNEMLPVKYAGEPISSTRIRREITSGNVELANVMLGRNFHVYGTLREGGVFIPHGNHILPKDGKYAIFGHEESGGMTIHKGKVTLSGMDQTGYTAVGVARRLG